MSVDESFQVDGQRSTKASAAVRLADLLRAQILDGHYPANSQLPAESELRTATGCGRNVVRAALNLLCQDGFVSRRPGRGTVVRSERARLPVDRPVGISNSFNGGGQRVLTRFRSIDEQPAIGPVARRLELAEGSRCVVVEYETLVDRRPYAVASSYLDASRWRNHFLTDLAGDWYGDWYAVLGSLGFEPGELSLRMESTSADEETATALGIEQAEPIFRFERLLLGADRRPLDFGFSRCRADRVVLDFQLQPTI